MNCPLTARQAVVLEMIKAFSATRGRSPTIREVAAAIGARSTDTVMSHLKALRQKGFLRRERQIALAERHPDVVVVVIPVNRGQDPAKRPASSGSTE